MTFLDYLNALKKQIRFGYFDKSERENRNLDTK